VPGKVLIVETYSAERYAWFFSKLVGSKRKQGNRGKIGASLLRWAETQGVALGA
jgi:hypothetical protein